MRLVLDSFWRALAYCALPRVVALSVLPLVLMVGLAGSLSWLFWEPALASIRQALEASSLLSAALGWLDAIGAAGLHAVLAPLLLVALVLPVLIVGCLLLVAQFMTPALVSLIARRRFPSLQRRHGASVWLSGLRATGLSVMAIVLLMLSLPLWLIPPLAFIIPPLVWGWLTMQLLAFDVLADHASPQERHELIHAHRWPLLAMGVITSLLGAAPSAVWAVGALALVLAPLVMVVCIWIYTAVFAFSSLWFAHYLLAALQVWRLNGPDTDVIEEGVNT